MSDAVPATTDAAPAPAETTAPETAATAPPATAAAPAAAATLSFVPGEAGSAATKAVLSSTEERAAAIKRQVEFYFSEPNLAKDKFLRGEMAKPESEGWVAIKVLGTFNRMKALNPSGEESEVASALSGSEVVEISPCKTKLRRFPALSKKTVTLGGKTFSSRSEVIGFARPLLDSKTELDAAGTTFVTELLAHHEKAAEKIGVGIKSIKPGSNPKWPETKCFVLVRTDGTEEDFSYIKCVNALFPLEAEPPSRTRSSKRKAEAGDLEPPSKKGPAAGPPEVSYTKGTILVVRALPEGQNVTTLKEAFNTASGKPGSVKFVEVVEGQPLAYVRFAAPEGAAAALAAKPEGVGELSVLEGGDEKAYWDKIGGGGKPGGGKGGKGGGKGGGSKGGKGGRAGGRGGRGKAGGGGRGKGRY